MSHKSLSHLIIAFIFLINNLSADSIKLKNGTVLEGKIVEETTDSITIEYKVTKSINDIKTVKRSDVLEIQKEPEDEKAFKKLNGILPTDDLLSAEDYDEIINGPLTEFLNAFPASKLKGKVQEVVDELKKEKALIESGSVKLNSNWISPEEAAKDNYNHSARIVLAKMQTMSKKGNFQEAFNYFEELQNKFPHSIAYTNSIPAALENLPKYDIILTREEKAYQIRTKEREEQYKSMDAQDKLRTEQAFQSAMKKFQEKVEEAQTMKKVWLPINQWDLKSIQGARQTIVKETKRLESINLTANRTTSIALSNAFLNVSSGDLENAKKELAVAKTNGARGQAIDDLSDKIDNGLKEKQETERAAAIAAAEIERKEKEDSEKEAKEKKKAEDEALAEAEYSQKNSNSNINSITPEPEEGGGIPLQTILIIIVVLLSVSTVCAKVFLKPKEETTGFSDDAFDSSEDS